MKALSLFFFIFAFFVVADNLVLSEEDRATYDSLMDIIDASTVAHAEAERRTEEENNDIYKAQWKTYKNSSRGQPFILCADSFIEKGKVKQYTRRRCPAYFGRFAGCKTQYNAGLDIVRSHCFPLNFPAPIYSTCSFDQTAYKLRAQDTVYTCTCGVEMCNDNLKEEVAKWRYYNKLWLNITKQQEAEFSFL